MHYALIDTAVRSDAKQVLMWHTQGCPSTVRSLFARQPERNHAHAGPWLVALDGNSGLQAWLQTLDMEMGAVAWLTADVGFESLFEHLETCLDIRLSDGGLALFRFWDGRVFWRIQSVLRLEQRRALMGPVTRWALQINGQPWALEPAMIEEFR
ncbi:hypothetical protein C1924_08550 [Stenotrophomonas sp. ESTM1D_MKCIP4_1]|uniref:DUF4123 domain-containing protein n=1 Tax=Stenotrophomonas sp. ESTM1D_MKCIP4_1 TaxID=2072414 RepID=UPI000D540D71|nr:DUF4123 domain-containing protein [Stenotrophomonas sp. ESTM1D_MKCIP4_1]AWH53226.1 hypothetical protein C1924_08550 [Stenotrophomonas sp. ESTM1D_MKCIP4_1]